MRKTKKIEYISIEHLFFAIHEIINKDIEKSFKIKIANFNLKTLELPYIKLPANKYLKLHYPIIYYNLLLLAGEIRVKVSQSALQQSNITKSKISTSNLLTKSTSQTKILTKNDAKSGGN